MIEKFDLWVVEWVERFCQQIQIWTGKTNFFLGAMLSLLLMAFIVSPLLHMSSPEQLDFSDGVVLYLAKKYPVMFSFFVLGLLKFRVLDYTIEEEKAQERIMEGVSNPEKISIRRRIMRLVMLCSVASFYFTSMYFGFPAKLFYYIFVLWLIELISACDPLPPCGGKFQQWISTAFLKPATQSSSANREGSS